MALGLARVPSIWNQPSQPGTTILEKGGWSNGICDLTSGAVPTATLPPDLSPHRHQPQIDRQSLCQVDLVRCGLVSAEEATSWIGSSESRAPTKASPAGSSSGLPEPCPKCHFFCLSHLPLDHPHPGWRACSTGAWAVDDLLLHIIAAVRHPSEHERTGNFPIEAYSRLDIHTRHTAPIRVARAPLSPACQAAAVSLLRGAQSSETSRVCLHLTSFSSALHF